MNTINLKEPMVFDELEGIDELEGVDELEGIDEAFAKELSELPEAIPSGEHAPAQNITIASSYTVDDQGLLNNYAIMPPMYVEEATDSRINKKYLQMQMMASFFIIAIALLVALLVS